MGTVYLIHFSRRYKHAGHYVGFTTDLDKRLTDHLCGMGARLMTVLMEAGIEWKCVRTWEGVERAFERRLKRWKGASRFCPECVGKKVAMRRVKGGEA